MKHKKAELFTPHVPTIEDRTKSSGIRRRTRIITVRTLYMDVWDQVYEDIYPKPFGRMR